MVFLRARSQQNLATRFRVAVDVRRPALALGRFGGSDGLESERKSGMDASRTACSISEL